jgi:uncharacterized phage-associated protein
MSLMGSGVDPLRNRKTVEAAAAILSGAGGTLPITSLNKAMFYADLCALLEHGETITGTTYLALKAGPVVAKYDSRVVGALERAGLAQQDESEDGFTKPVSLVAEPTMTLLTETEIQIARRIAEWASRKSPKQLSDFSHENLGWMLAWDAGLGSKNPAKPIDMLIAMQQLGEADDWLDAEPSSEERQAIESAHAARSADGGLELW